MWCSHPRTPPTSLPLTTPGPPTSAILSSGVASTSCFPRFLAGARDDPSAPAAIAAGRREKRLPALSPRNVDEIIFIHVDAAVSASWLSPWRPPGAADGERSALKRRSIGRRDF